MIDPEFAIVIDHDTARRAAWALDQAIADTLEVVSRWGWSQDRTKAITRDRLARGRLLRALGWETEIEANQRHARERAAEAVAA